AQRIDVEVVDEGRDQDRAFGDDGHRAGEAVDAHARFARKDAADGGIEEDGDAEQPERDANAAPGDGEEFDAEDEKGSSAGSEGRAKTADVGHRWLRGKAI